MRNAIAICVVALVMGVAQANAGGGQLTLYGGYLHPGELNLDSVRTGLSLRGTSLYGVRAEFDFLKVFGVEQNFGFSPRLFNSTLFPEGSSADVRGFLYSTNLVVNVPMGRLVPYATAGLGLVKPWGVDFNTFDTTFAGNYGGGIKMNRLIGPAGLRFDIRGWRTADIANQGGINLFEATGGITFSWGGD